MKIKFTYLTRYTMWLLMIMLTSISQLTYAQTKINVKGIVKDVSGNILPGATIKVAGTAQATVTDVNGVFKIEVNDGATLNISFVSMVTKTVQVNKDHALINIVLEDKDKQLNEVVVVGYGTQKR